MNDETPPTVAFVTPASGALVSGSIVLSATASDNLGVAGVKFLLDGSPLGAEDTAAPYEVTWNTAGASNGEHVLTAVARDAARQHRERKPRRERVERWWRADCRDYESWRRQRQREHHGRSNRDGRLSV